MKRFAGIVFLALMALALTSLAPAAQAQEERGEFGIFADYTRLHHLDDANFWGIGGQLAFNLNDHVQLEGGMAYDFERSFTTSTTSPLGSTTFERSGLRLLHGVFGPKFQTGVGPVKAFVVLKGGFLNFSVSEKGPVTGFAGAVRQVPSGDTNGVFYPGGGLEFFAGRIGLRLEVGDLMYFEDGANHNLKVAVGPQFRF